MKIFDQIEASSGATGAGVMLDTTPPIRAVHNAGGGPAQESLVFELVNADPAGTHLTIYQNSWDEAGPVQAYGEADLGPKGLHLTYNINGAVRHVFAKMETDGNIQFLTDDATDREMKTMKLLVGAISKHLL